MQAAFRSDPDAETVLAITGLDFDIATIAINNIDWVESSNNCARLTDPLNAEKIEDYGSSINRGDVFPRCVVERGKSGYVILGGNQRCAAYKSVGVEHIEVYVVDPLTSGEREAVIRSLNSRHGWGSTKSERLQHAVYLVRKFGHRVEDAARLMVVSESAINEHIRAEDSRVELIKKGVSEAVSLPITTLSQIARVKDEDVKVRIAESVTSNKASAAQAAELVHAVLNSRSKAQQSKEIAEFNKRISTGKKIAASKPGIRNKRRDKFLSSLVQLSQFLEAGNDGGPFSTLDELNCSIAHDLDNVRVLTAKITSRLRCICEAQK